MTVTCSAYSLHMHVRDMTFYATPPDARQLRNRRRSPTAQLEWQLGYEIKPGTSVAQGNSRLSHGRTSTPPANPHNPDPDKFAEYAHKP
ncbi:MAG: hypothetical protein R3C56_03960 [Pirellulaceae bacterium]